MARRCVKVLLAFLAVSLLVSCTSKTPNYLVNDPMADVTLDQAERVRRTVTDPSTGSSLSKQREAEVLQVYETNTPERTVQELVRRATRAGWVFDKTLTGLGVGQLATKTIEGVEASLTIAQGDDSRHVVLSLTRQPTE